MNCNPFLHFWLVGVLQDSVLGHILFILYTEPLSDIISHHSVLCHMSVDDYELYKSDSWWSFHYLTTIKTCILDVKIWFVLNKLQKWKRTWETLLNLYLSYIILYLLYHWSLCNQTSCADLNQVQESEHMLTVALWVTVSLGTEPGGGEGGGAPARQQTLFSLFSVQPWTLKFSMSQGCAGGLSGRDPFSTLDLSSGTLKSKLKPTSSLLPTDLLSLFLLISTTPITSIRVS